MCIRDSIFGRGAAETGPAAHRVFDAENRENILADSRLDGLHFGKRELFKALFLRSCDSNEAPGDVVRLAKRQFQGPHQPIGEIGRGRIAQSRGRFHAVSYTHLDVYKRQRQCRLQQ